MTDQLLGEQKCALFCLLTRMEFCNTNRLRFSSFSLNEFHFQSSVVQDVGVIFDFTYLLFNKIQNMVANFYFGHT